MPDLPHVTGILYQAGLVDTRWFTDEARDRGSAVHLATQYLDEGDLHWPDLDPSVVSKVKRYQQFKDEVRPEILSIEEAVINEAYQYQGRLDRIVVIGGRKGVLDIKSLTKAPWQAIQVAMYAACFPGPSLARWTLHLSDERYQLIEHTNRGDWRVAAAAITLAAWRESNGI
jgi:hypothetical protein